MSRYGDFWKRKLTPFDYGLCSMVAAITEMDCEPKNGGDHFFIEADYRKHNDPQFILALRDAIEGRTGERLLELHDDPERTCLWARVRFDAGDGKDAEFVPKKCEDNGD